MKLYVFHRRLPEVSEADWLEVWHGPYAEGLAKLPGAPRVTLGHAVADQPAPHADGIDEIAWDHAAAARDAAAGRWLPYLLERIGSLEPPGWPQGGLMEELIVVPPPDWPQRGSLEEPTAPPPDWPQRRFMEEPAAPPPSGWPQSGSTEEPAAPPPPGRGAKRLGTVHRRPDLSPEAFARHWTMVHAPLARLIPGLAGYVLARTVEAVPSLALMDGVATLWFVSREAADQAGSTPEGRRAAEDNENFLDRSRLVLTWIEDDHAGAAQRPRAGTTGEWRNWSGSVRCHPRRAETPTDEIEVAAIVRDASRAGLSVRVAGTGHSFTPLCASDGVIVSLDGLSGLLSADPAAGEATVWGGSTIHALGPLLRERGLAMESMGDIDRQTIAGAVSTGTHGTGAWFGSISTQVTGLTLVTATGERVECSPTSEPAVFESARVALGALGVITRVRLRLRPAFRLHEMRWDWPFSRAMEALTRLIADNHHFEFFWSSRGDVCAMKSLNPTDREPGEPAPGQRIDWSDRVFPSERTFTFNEMEFALAAENGPDCMHEIRTLMRGRHADVAWPVEYRTVAADDIPLSPAYGRPTVTISVHQAAQLPHQSFFADVESVFRNHRGRPHWGKMHTHTTRELAALYPLWDRFQDVRRRLDPHGRFLNDHLRAILGV